MPTPRSGGTSARGEASRTYIGWRHEVLLSHPGAEPRRPAPGDVDNPGEEWAAAERDNEAQTNRPLYIALGGLVLLALIFLLLWLLRVLPGVLALGGVFACAAIAVPVVVALVQSRQVVAERLARARKRLAAEREERDHLLYERQRAHAREHTEWQAAVRAYEAQPHWYGVTLPERTEAAVVVGGTDTGWSALLTTIGVSRLREGGDLTVVDLTGRAVSRELARLARRCAVAPRHWVLPADLPRMTLGTNLDAGQRARILSAVAAAAGGEDVDADETLLLRLLEVLGPHAGIDELIGGLRALLTGEDDSAEDDPALALLTDEQRTRVRERCGADPEVGEHAWKLERLLAPFEAVGTRGEEDGYAQIKIISTDRASGEAAARVYGTYAVAALSELLEARVPGGRAGGRAPRARPDRTRTVVVCGAELLPEEEITQVLAAASESGVEVVLMFGTGTSAALSRFSDPAFLPVVMRQPESEAESVARAAAELPGVEDTVVRTHRLSEVVGEKVEGSVTEQEADPDSEIVDEERFFPSPHTESGAVVRNAAAAVAPLDLVRHVRSTTAWGRATAQSEEADVPPEEEHRDRTPLRTSGLDAALLRELPITGALVLGPEGPVLADTNPGILTLSTATLATVDDSRHTGHGSDGEGRAAGGGADGAGRARGRGPRIVPATGTRGTVPDTATEVVRSVEPPARVGADTVRPPDRVPPNLGPPPERLDWRS